jgi:hypothetical protein
MGRGIVWCRDIAGWYWITSINGCSRDGRGETQDYSRTHDEKSEYMIKSDGGGSRQQSAWVARNWGNALIIYLFLETPCLATPRFHL